MMLIDEHTSIAADADRVSARALHCSLSHGMWQTTADGDVASPSRAFRRMHAWLWHRGCAVSIEAEEVSLTGISSHEAAIARIEQHLRGPHDVQAHVDPLCQCPTELWPDSTQISAPLACLNGNRASYAARRLRPR